MYYPVIGDFKESYVIHDILSICLRDDQGKQLGGYEDLKHTPEFLLF